MARLPVLIFIVVFALSITLTQFLAYQQYTLSKEKTTAELMHEATEAKDRFRNILFNDIAAANTLAIIYKQYGVPANFDSVAHQIIQNSRYAEVLQITENGIVKNVYPDTHYKSTIGTNVNADPVRKAEEARAVEFKAIYFAGPRRLRFGDTGILGKVPIIINNKVVAVTTVLTRLSAIKKALAPPGAGRNRFAYELQDTHVKHSPFYLLSDSKPTAKSEHADVYIPEGDWRLRVSYINKYVVGSLPFELSGLGILFSIIVALLAYRKAQEPYKLKKIIDEKTQQLAKSEKYFRTLIETSSDAVVLMDSTGKVLYQSPSTERILGYTLAEIQQIDGIELIYPDDRVDDNKLFAEIVNNPGSIISRKHRIKHKNGNYLHIEGAYRNLLNDDSVAAIVYTYRDITEKILAEHERKAIYDELIRSEANLKSMFDTTDVSFLLIDINYKIMALNQQMKDGYLASAGLELKVGDNLIESMHPQKKTAAKAIYDEVIQTNCSKNYETAYEFTGVHIHYMANVKPIHDGTKVIGICISALDITERKKMTLDLLSQVHAIEEQNKKLREIAWIQSHIVRAPLARIMGLIDLFKNHSDADKHTILDYMVVSAAELDEVIKSISDKVYADEDDLIQPS